MLKTISSITNAIGALNFKGTWNASTNTPTIVSSVGVKGDYYVVSVGGSTNINGISNWGVGDWITFNGSVWQRVEGGADLNGVNLTVSGNSDMGNIRIASNTISSQNTDGNIDLTPNGTGRTTVTNLTTTSPRIVTSLNDTNGNEVFNITATASAVNEFTLQNSATGAGVILSSTGADTNVNINISPKGAGTVNIGTTSSSGKLTVQTTTTSERGLYVKQAAASSNEATAAARFSKASNTSTTGQVFVEFTINNDAAGSGQINANGASQAAFGSFSDARLKQNIVDLSNQLDKLCALRPVEFDYIESEGGGHQIGFIAQELQEIYPDAVGKRAPDGMLTVTGWNKTEARVVKAIQEQQILIENLGQRILKLESKGN